MKTNSNKPNTTGTSCTKHLEGILYFAPKVWFMSRSSTLPESLLDRQKAGHSLGFTLPPDWYIPRAWMPVRRWGGLAFQQHGCWWGARGPGSLDHICLLSFETASICVSLSQAFPPPTKTCFTFAYGKTKDLKTYVSQRTALNQWQVKSTNIPHPRSMIS